MNADIVVDVGNSRIKCGRCDAEGVKTIVSLPHDRPREWQAALESWDGSNRVCIVAGVNPPQRDLFSEWLAKQGQEVHLLDSPARLPLQVKLERPDHVGIDRLLDAVAANSHRPADRPAVIVDAGSAITVDWLDESGAFLGGAICPGLRLMSEALHNYTALLPLVQVTEACPEVPGVSTRAAVAAGVFWTAAGAINTLIGRMAEPSRTPPVVFLAGGDAALLSPGINHKVELWPEITLEGIRLTALSW